MKNSEVKSNFSFKPIWFKNLQSFATNFSSSIYQTPLKVVIHGLERISTQTDFLVLASLHEIAVLVKKYTDTDREHSKFLL